MTRRTKRRWTPLERGILFIPVLTFALSDLQVTFHLSWLSWVLWTLLITQAILSLSLCITYLREMKQVRRAWQREDARFLAWQENMEMIARSDLGEEEQRRSLDYLYRQWKAAHTEQEVKEEHEEP